MTNILVASTPVYGHFAPMLSIARELVAGGHALTFLTGEQYRPAVEGIGARFVPLTGSASYDPAATEEPYPERSALPAGFPRLEFDMIHFFIDPIRDQYESIVRIIADRDEETVVVQDAWFLGTWPFKLGVAGPRPKAVVSIGISPPPLTSIDTAPFGPGLPPDSSAAGRAGNQKLNNQTYELFAPAQAHLIQVLKDIGADEPAPFAFDGMVTLPDLYLQLSIEGFEYPRSDAPATFRCVGMLTTSSEQAPALPDWWGEVSSADTVVVVTQGTVANRDFTELIEPTLQALDGLDVLVVALTGRPAQLSRVPANTRVAEFIPMDLLLPHADVVVSNGGYGGTQLTLSHGVPMVLAGTSEDKPEVAARAAWAGVAINLATDRPERASLRAAVETVLTNPGYRASAQRLQAEYARHDARTEIRTTIENLLR